MYLFTVFQPQHPTPAPSPLAQGERGGWRWRGGWGGWWGQGRRGRGWRGQGKGGKGRGRGALTITRKSYGKVNLRYDFCHRPPRSPGRATGRRVEPGTDSPFITDSHLTTLESWYALLRAMSRFTSRCVALAQGSCSGERTIALTFHRMILRLFLETKTFCTLHPVHLATRNNTFNVCKPPPRRKEK